MIYIYIYKGLNREASNDGEKGIERTRYTPTIQKSHHKNRERESSTRTQEKHETQNTENTENRTRA